MKFSDLIKNKPDDTIETTIGTLAVFSLNIRLHKKLTEKFGQHLEKSNAKEFIRYLIGLVCHKKQSHSESKCRPKDKTITDEEISKLSERDLEKFSECFIKHNKQLTHEISSGKKTKDDNRLLHPRLEKETYIDYLYRLEKLYAEDESKRRDKMKEHLSGITNSFSLDTQRKIASESNMAARLANQLGQQHSSIHPILAEQSPESSLSQTIEDINRQRQERAERPFREISERLGNMNNNLVDIGEYNLQFADTQKSILFELQESGQTNQKSTKDNKKLTWLVIIITFCFGAIQIMSAILGNLSSSREQQELLRTNQSSNQLIEELVDVVSTSNSKQKELERKYNQLSKKLQTSEMKSVQLENTIQQLKFQLEQVQEN